MDGRQTEVIGTTLEGREESWATQVADACKNKCSNCGSDHRLKPVMIVPEEAGGQKIVSNGTLLCRTCELAKDIGARHPSPASGEHTRPINFFVSRGLHAKLKNGLASKYGFRSVSALVRFLMSRYVADSERFDDVSMYQDSGSDVKVNVWVGRDLYGNFKAVVDRQGVTVTDTLKGLIRMYESEAGRIAGRTEA